MIRKVVLNLLSGSSQIPWYLAPYFVLTITLLVVTLVYPIAQAENSVLLNNLVLPLLMLSAFYAVIEHKWVFRTLGALLVPILIGLWFIEPVAGSYWSLCPSIATTLFLLITTLSVLLHVITAKRVNADLIYGSVAVYLLLGIIVALIFLFLHNLEPGSVVPSMVETNPFGDGCDNYAVFLYLSFITMTSVGYGELTPYGAAARSVAVFTGLFGQLYVAILIAKLVGLHTAQSMKDSNR